MSNLRGDKGGGGDNKKEKGVREKERQCEHYVLRKVAHSVLIMLHSIPESWNVSSGPRPSHISEADTYFGELHLFPLHVCF